MTKFTPISDLFSKTTLFHDNVLLEVFDALSKNEASKGGIIVIDQATEEERLKRLIVAKVLNIGPGGLIEEGPKAGQRMEIPLQPGDWVLISPYTGTEASLDTNGKYRVVSELKIFAKINFTKNELKQYNLK